MSVSKFLPICSKANLPAGWPGQAPAITQLHGLRVLQVGGGARLTSLPVQSSQQERLIPWPAALGGGQQQNGIDRQG